MTPRKLPQPMTEDEIRLWQDTYSRAIECYGGMFVPRAARGAAWQDAENAVAKARKAVKTETTLKEGHDVREV